MRTLILLLISFTSFAQVDTAAKKYSFGPNRLKDTAWNKANTRLDGNVNLRGLNFTDTLHYLGIDANNNVRLYPISAVVSGVVSVNGQTGVVTLDIPFYADSILRAFDSITAHNLRLINLRYEVDTAKQNIRNEIAAIPSVSLGDSIVVLYDSISAHNLRLITIWNRIDTTSANLYAWAWATFLTSETDPLSFHKVDSNTAGEAVTYSYYWGNLPSVAGYLQTSDTATMLAPYLCKADSNFNSGYETYYHAAVTYQQIGTYITPSDTAAMLSAYARLLIYFPADTTISAAYTITSRDFHRTIHCTNGSDIALTIPTGLGTTFVCVVKTEGLGTVTPTASGTAFSYQPTSTTKISAKGGATIQSDASADNYLIIGSLE